MSNCQSCRFKEGCVLDTNRSCKFFLDESKKESWQVKDWKYRNKCVVCYNKFNSQHKEYFCPDCMKKKIQKKLEVF